MKITAIKYSATMQRIYELESLEEIPALQEEKFVLWIVERLNTSYTILI